MRQVHSSSKIISVFLVMLILLQSCSVYQKTSVTLDEATKSNSKVRIERANQKNLDVKKIEFKEGAYYGIKKVNGEITPIPLDEKEIKSVRMLNKPKSDLGTAGLIALSIGLIGAFILAATYDVSN